MRQADPMGFGHQLKQTAVAVETPGTPLFDDIEAWFVVSVKQAIGDLAVWGLIGEFKGLGSEPLDADHRYQAVWKQTPNAGMGLKVFESNHLWPKLVKLTLVVEGRCSIFIIPEISNKCNDLDQGFSMNTIFFRYRRALETFFSLVEPSEILNAFNTNCIGV